MGMKARGSPKVKPLGLADALFSSTQQRVLGLLFDQPERSFLQSELIRLARAGTGAVQRELERLTRAGIVLATSSDGRKRLQANPSSPIFEELRSIVEKTSGVAQQLQRALEPARERVRFGMLYGSVAKGSDTATSDVDVLLVTDELTQEDAFRMFRETEARLGRTVNPTIYTSEEFKRRRRSRNPFLEKVLAGKYVVLVGSLDALAP